VIAIVDLEHGVRSIPLANPRDVDLPFVRPLVTMHGLQFGIAEEHTSEVRVEDAHHQECKGVSNLGGIGFDPKRRQAR
jgi:hypothetical protein